MATANIQLNPARTSFPGGMFDGATASGGVQGTAMPDPSTLWALRTSTLSPNETIPMWGGVAVYENISTGASTGPVQPLGPVVGRATSITGGSFPIAGFSVFDQGYSAVTTAQSQVPVVGSYGQVMTYRLGSGARIWVACDPGLVSLRGGAISQAVSWDLVNQILIPEVGATTISSGTYDANTTISSGTYNATTGLVTLTLAAASHLSPGNTFTISAATGTGSFTSINGTFTAGAGTTGATVTFTIPTSLTLTITGGTFVSGTVVLTMASAVNLSPGDTVIVSGATGSGSFASINGTFTAQAGTTASTVVYNIAAGLTLTITGGSLTTGGVLPCSILDISVGNSMTVAYSAATGFANWNFSGSTALIQI